jgi:hypothetical protein
MEKPLLVENLGYGFMGGVACVVWDRSREKNNDYLTVAFIDDNGVIEYHASVSDEQKAAIEQRAYKEIESTILRLTSEALGLMANSPKQLAVRERIEDLRAKLPADYKFLSIPQ